MVVAVITVGVVKMPIHQVVHMIPMWNRLVTTTGPMNVIRRMPRSMLRSTDVRIRGADGNGVLIDMIAVRMVQMAIVQIVHMSFMDHGGVTTPRTMLVVVVLMMGLLANCHVSSP